MGTFASIEKWGNDHRPSWLFVVRIALGVFLTYKGIHFMLNLDELQTMTTTAGFASLGLAHYVIWAHILGGPMIALGIFTRVVAVMQIPILIGAIVFVNYPQGFMSVGNHMELEVSIIVLVLLIETAIFGAGTLSVDRIRRRDLAQG